MSKVLRAAEGTATAATATATITGFTPGTAANTGGWLFIKGFIITTSAVPTVSAVATLAGADTLSPLHYQLGPNALFPFAVWFPDAAALRVASTTPATNIVLTVPTLGVTVTAQLFAFVE